MRSITIHNIEPELSSRIEKQSHENGTSLNKTIKSLLLEAVGLSAKGGARLDEFSDLSGVWSRKEANQFMAAISECGKVDKEDWS